MWELIRPASVSVVFIDREVFCVWVWATLTAVCWSRCEHFTSPSHPIILLLIWTRHPPNLLASQFHTIRKPRHGESRDSTLSLQNHRHRIPKSKMNRLSFAWFPSLPLDWGSIYNISIYPTRLTKQRENQTNYTLAIHFSFNRVQPGFFTRSIGFCQLCLFEFRKRTQKWKPKKFSCTSLWTTHAKKYQFFQKHLFFTIFPFLKLFFSIPLSQKNIYWIKNKFFLCTIFSSK